MVSRPISRRLREPSLYESVNTMIAAPTTDSQIWGSTTSRKIVRSGAPITRAASACSLRVDGMPTMRKMVANGTAHTTWTVIASQSCFDRPSSWARKMFAPTE